MKQDKKDTKEKYKLYKSVREVLHPTISKKNISNYKIILDEKLFPIRIFYPEKVTNLSKVIIYIQTSSKVINNDYSKILSFISKESDRLVISIDYDDSESLKKQIANIYNTYKYIYQGLKTNGIKAKNITLIGDSIGSSIIISMFDKAEKDKINDVKTVLFYPVLIGETIKNNDSPIDYEIINNIKEYYQEVLKKKRLSNKDLFGFKIEEFKTYPKTLIICGAVDPFVNEIKVLAGNNPNIELHLISFASHNILNSTDREIVKEYKKILLEYINND